MPLSFSRADMETVSRQDFDAVVLDLDGVVTRTKDTHARAWKQCFDEFLEARAEATGEAFEPFDIDRDYYRWVDGKPRYDGVASFLAARNIELPRGSPDDPPDTPTVCGIGNRKNRIFLDLLEREGVETYASSLEFLRRLREAGFKTAIVSSSRNCVPVLAAAGALELFDAKIDGRDLEARSLRGKPAPDIFRAAVDDLGVPPERAVAIEDALAGVAAAREAGYGEVIGVDRDAQAQELGQHGAHLVIADLAEVDVASAGKGNASTGAGSGVPDELLAQLHRQRLAIFLDFDGTLTPIVEQPDEANLSEAMRDTLRCLADHYVTAVISGRDLADVRARVGLDGLIYAGSHGFDIALPDGRRTCPAPARDAVPALRRATDRLERELARIDGVLVEAKEYATAIHYRNVSDEAAIADVEAAVDAVLADVDGLRKRGGKRIFELLPDIDWDKGEALSWLLEMLGLDDSEVLPVYIGDDVTDEDAFAVLQGRGVGIAVRADDRATSADYTVRDPQAVQALLERLCEAAVAAT